MSDKKTKPVLVCGELKQSDQILSVDMAVHEQPVGSCWRVVPHRSVICGHPAGPLSSLRPSQEPDGSFVDSFGLLSFNASGPIHTRAHVRAHGQNHGPKSCVSLSLPNWYQSCRRFSRSFPHLPPAPELLIDVAVTWDCLLSAAVLWWFGSRQFIRRDLDEDS